MSSILFLPLILKSLIDSSVLKINPNKSLVFLIALVFLFIVNLFLINVPFGNSYNLFFTGLVLYIFEIDLKLKNRQLFYLAIPFAFLFFKISEVEVVHFGLFLCFLSLSYSYLQNNKVNLVSLFLISFVTVNFFFELSPIVDILLVLGFFYQLNEINNERETNEFLLGACQLIFIGSLFSPTDINEFIIIKLLLTFYLCFKEQRKGDILALALLLYIGDINVGEAKHSLTFLALHLTCQSIVYLKERFYSIDKDKDRKLILDHFDLVILSLMILLLTGIPGTVTTYLGANSLKSNIISLSFVTFYCLKTVSIKSRNFPRNEKSYPLLILLIPLMFILGISIYNSNYETNYFSMIPLVVLIAFIFIFERNEDYRVNLNKWISQYSLNFPRNRQIKASFNKKEVSNRETIPFRVNIYLVSQEVYSLLLIIFIMAFVYRSFL